MTTSRAALAGLLIGLAGLAMTPLPGAAPDRPSVAFEVAGPGVVMLTGPNSGLELHEVRPPSRPFGGPTESFPGLAGGICGVTSSGIGTHTGRVRPPVHFATVVDWRTGRRMRILAQAASTDKGFITRSALGWDGQLVPGVWAMGRNYNRTWGPGPLHEQEKATAVLHLRLPGESGVRFLFVGHDWRGQPVPPFEHRQLGFAGYVEAMQAESKRPK